MLSFSCTNDDVKVPSDWVSIIIYSPSYCKMRINTDKYVRYLWIIRCTLLTKINTETLKSVNSTCSTNS